MCQYGGVDVRARRVGVVQGPFELALCGLGFGYSKYKPIRPLYLPRASTYCERPVGGLEVWQSLPEALDVAFHVLYLNVVVCVCAIIYLTATSLSRFFTNKLCVQVYLT